MPQASPEFNYAIETRVQRHINNKANTQAAAAAFGGHQGNHHHTPPRHCPSLRSVLVGAARGGPSFIAAEASLRHRLYTREPLTIAKRAVRAHREREKERM